MVQRWTGLCSGVDWDLGCGSIMDRYVVLGWTGLWFWDRLYVMWF